MILVKLLIDQLIIKFIFIDVMTKALFNYSLAILGEVYD